MKLCKKLLALVLSVFTLLGVFSCSTTVFAEEYNSYVAEQEYRDKLLTQTVENENQQAEIVCEVREKRDEYSKTYKRADGSFTTIFSQTPLHKLEGAEWVEIDNTLQSSGDVIENIDGRFNIEFPESLSEDNKITIENDGESISFSLNNINESTAEVAPKAENADVVENDLSKPLAEITYENIGEKTDVQYIVTSDSVKENIIVSDKNSLKDTYSFNIEKGNLTATLGEDSSVTFKNAQGEVAFTIPAPVMADANNATSYDIAVSIANENTDTLTLTYTPSKAWLEDNERVYPVTIDPVITFPNEGDSVIEDTMIAKSSASSYYQSVNFYDETAGVIAKNFVSSDNACLNTDVLIKIHTDTFEPLAKQEIEITDVDYVVAGAAMKGTYTVREINGEWNPQTITYNNVYPPTQATPQITYGTEIIDWFTGNFDSLDDEEYSTISIDITESFAGWLRGEENNGFAVVAETEGTAAVLALGEYSNASANGMNCASYLSIDYVDTSCGNDSFEYLTQEVGRAGTAYVNTFSRSLSLTRSDISMDGLRMPANVGFAYNPAFRNFADLYLSSTGQSIEIPYGNNWLPLNIQALFCTGENQWQAYTGEGTIVAFNQTTETIEETDDEGNITTTTQIVFEPEETSDTGYSLELIDDTKAPSTTNLKLIAPDGTSAYFYPEGVVMAVCNSEDTLTSTTDDIRYIYKSGTSLGLSKITDGVGRQYVFSYSTTTGLLEKINCLTADGTQIKAGTTNTDLCVTYSYDNNGNLTGVTYPDGKTATYTYSGDSLVKAENIDGYSIQYTYDALGKVTKLQEYAGTTAGNLITLQPLSNRQVKITDGYTGTQVQQFGRDGKLHYTFDDKGNYSKSDYAPANDENVYSENGWAVVPENLLKNGAFDTALNGLPTEWDNAFSVDFDTTNIYDNFCKVESTTATEKLQSQTVDVDGGKSYTFSIYAKYVGEEIQSTDKLSLNITAYFDGGKTTESVLISPTNEFEQYSVSVKTTKEITNVKVEFGLEYATGNFLVNNAQLERGNGTADFNYIENGTFACDIEKWSNATVINDSINGEAVNAVKLTGGLPVVAGSALNDNISAVTQTVKINGKKNDVFSVGGWFKGKFDDNHISEELDNELSLLTSSLAQIKVSYSYVETTTDENANEATETKTEEFAVDFQPHNDGWQYAVDSFVLKADVSTVDVTVMAKNIPADSFATNVSLTKNENNEFIEEETDEEAEETCSCGCEECSYGEGCPCTGAVEEKCQCPDCLREETTTEDSFGNTLSNKSTDGISYIETFSSYTTDGNYLASYTDENGNETTYDYNTLNGILEAVTSPMGTGTQTTTTSYAYDEMGNLVCVSTDNKALQYVYTNDRLTQLVTPNGSFKIIYDAWGQVLSVNVVTTNDNLVPLVTYTYNTGSLRTQVATATYRNSATNDNTYQYTYDTDGNITNIKINNNDKHNITYSSLGELIEIDNVGGRKVKYTDNGVYIYNAENQLIYTSVTNSDGKEREENYGIKYKEQESQYSYDSATGVSTETTALDIASYYRVSQSAVTDWFGREKSHTTTVYDITEETEETPAETIGKIATEYSYSSATDGKTSNSIEKYVNRTYNGDSESVRVYDGYSYEYDKQNRISAINQLDILGAEAEMYSYEYDKLGQLVRYNDKVAKKSYTYIYDGNGNITSKSEYAYTIGVLGEATNTTAYTYDTQWKDKLASVGDKTITYDNIGNPTSYLGANLTWEGRQLTSYSNDEYTSTYEYDENGMRYRTSVLDIVNENSAFLEYVWADGKLVSLVYGDDSSTNTAKYLYNEFDEPVGMVLTGETGSPETYYYLKNAQGDITHIIDSSGKKKVSFSYDAFGKVTETYYANITTITGIFEYIKQKVIRTVTPFGYRGYCYDTFTGLYYLQSRYYDPNTGRFINADDTNYLNATGTVLGCNLFAYCENDPVNRVDPKGTVSLNYLSVTISSFKKNNIYTIVISLRITIKSFLNYVKTQKIRMSIGAIICKFIPGGTLASKILSVSKYCYKISETIIKKIKKKVGNRGIQLNVSVSGQFEKLKKNKVYSFWRNDRGYENYVYTGNVFVFNNISLGVKFI